MENKENARFANQVVGALRSALHSNSTSDSKLVGNFITKPQAMGPLQDVNTIHFGVPKEHHSLRLATTLLSSGTNSIPANPNPTTIIASLQQQLNETTSKTSLLQQQIQILQDGIKLKEEEHSLIVEKYSEDNKTITMTAAFELESYKKRLTEAQSKLSDLISKEAAQRSELENKKASSIKAVKEVAALKQERDSLAAQLLQLHSSSSSPASSAAFSPPMASINGINNVNDQLLTTSPVDFFSKEKNNNNNMSRFWSLGRRRTITTEDDMTKDIEHGDTDDNADDDNVPLLEDENSKDDMKREDTVNARLIGAVVGRGDAVILKVASRLLLQRPMVRVAGAVWLVLLHVIVMMIIFF